MALDSFPAKERFNLKQDEFIQFLQKYQKVKSEKGFREYVPLLDPIYKQVNLFEKTPSILLLEDISSMKEAFDSVNVEQMQFTVLKKTGQEKRDQQLPVSIECYELSQKCLKEAEENLSYKIERINQDDVYQVIIEESNDFLSQTHLIQIFNKKQQINLFQLTKYDIPLDQVIELKQQPMQSRDSTKQRNLLQKWKNICQQNGVSSLYRIKAGGCEFKNEIKKANTQEEGYNLVQNALYKKHSTKLILFNFNSYIWQLNIQFKMYILKYMMNSIINYIVIKQMKKGFVKIYYRTKLPKVKLIFNMLNIMMKLKKTSLSAKSINNYHIIHNPLQSQLVVLLVNKPNESFLNFYINLENKQVIQSDQDIEQIKIQMMEFKQLDFQIYKIWRYSLIDYQFTQIKDEFN